MFLSYLRFSFLILISFHFLSINDNYISVQISLFKLNPYPLVQDAAERFQEESGVSADIDLNLLDTRISIRDSIQVLLERLHSGRQRLILNIVRF